MNEETLGDAIAAEALKHLGVKEDPPHSNHTPFGIWAVGNNGMNGVAWCGNYVSFCVQEATGGARAVCEGTPMTTAYYGSGYDHGCFGDAGGRCFGCDHAPTIERWARGRHKAQVEWIDSEDPDLFQPGDILLIDIGGVKGHATHVGIFMCYEDDGATIVSVEGNYSDRVQLVRRDVDSDEVVGAGRLI